MAVTTTTASTSRVTTIRAMPIRILRTNRFIEVFEVRVFFGGQRPVLREDDAGVGGLLGGHLKLHTSRGDVIHRRRTHTLAHHERADSLGLEPAARNRGGETIGKLLDGDPGDRSIGRQVLVCCERGPSSSGMSCLGHKSSTGRNKKCSQTGQKPCGTGDRHNRGRAPCSSSPEAALLQFGQKRGSGLVVVRVENMPGIPHRGGEGIGRIIEKPGMVQS